MKVLKILALICLTALLTAFAALLQLDNAANSTLLSDSYFSRVFNGNIQAKDIDRAADNITNEAYVFMPLSAAEKTALQQGKASASLKKQANDFKSQLSRFIDKSWMETEVPKLLEGGYAYFTGGGEKLPAINIKPLKSAILDVYSEQIASGGGPASADQYIQMIDQIDQSSGGIVVKGKLNSKAVSSFQQMMMMTGMSVSKSTAQDILQHAASRKTDGSDKQEQFQYAVKAVMNDELGMGDMKDSLDLNAFVSNLFGSADNPVSGLRALISGLKSSLFGLLAIVTLLLLALVAVIAFSLKSIMRWTGAALLVSGALCLAVPVLVTVSGASIHSAVAQTLAQGAVDLSFLQSWANSYINGITLFLFVQCVVVVAIGAALCICAGLVDKRGNNVRGKRASGGHGGLRAVAAVVLLLSIPLSLYLFGKGITKQTEAYNDMIQRSQTHSVNVSHALDKTLGTDLFEGTK